MYASKVDVCLRSVSHSCLSGSYYLESLEVLESLAESEPLSEIESPLELESLWSSCRRGVRAAVNFGDCIDIPRTAVGFEIV